MATLVPAPIAVGAQSARAARCEVRLVPAEAGSDWQQPVNDLRRPLEVGAPAESDCRKVLVDARSKPARITVITADGRSATRPLDRPRELAAVVSALVVTLPPEPPRTADVVAPAAPAVAPATSAAQTQGVVFEVAGGMHVAAPGPLASPMLGAAARGLIGKWELTLSGSWDVRWASGSAPADLRMSGGQAGLSVGGRRSLGAFDVAGGLGGGAGYVRQQGTVSDAKGQGNMDDKISGSRIDMRVGAYLGVVFPARWRVRLRPQIGAELIPGRLARRESLDPELPALPSWRLTFALAVETDLL